MKLLILADDFTGAMDSGVQLSLRNIPTTVAVSPNAGENWLTEDCEVLSVNMETRHLSALDAYNCIRSFLEKYAIPGCYVYIKTDSALRGNVGPSFQAALDVLGGPLAFVPALPAMNRVTRNGICYIEGELLENSIFRHDPRTPALKSRIPEILSTSDTHFTCRIVPTSHIQDFDSLSAERSADVYLFDCETEAQIETIGEKLADCRLYGLTAGCAGFARTFHRHIPFRTAASAPPASNGPVLFVSGSVNDKTMAQLAAAQSLGYPVLSLSAAISRCFQEGADPENSPQDIFTEACSCLSHGRSVVLATALSGEHLYRAKDSEQGRMDSLRFHETVANLTASLVQSIIEETGLETLAVFGGDMVAAILKKLSCRKVSAWGEICSGVPLCTFYYRGKTRTLVSKSGGFGQPDVIPVIEQYFINQRRI